MPQLNVTLQHAIDPALNGYDSDYIRYVSEHIRREFTTLLTNAVVSAIEQASRAETQSILSPHDQIGRPLLTQNHTLDLSQLVHNIAATLTRQDYNQDVVNRALHQTFTHPTRVVWEVVPSETCVPTGAYMQRYQRYTPTAEHFNQSATPREPLMQTATSRELDYTPYPRQRPDGVDL